MKPKKKPGYKGEKKNLEHGYQFKFIIENSAGSKSSANGFPYHVLIKRFHPGNSVV